MFVLAGLGNPGVRYAHNRHNIGFDVVQAFAEATGAEPWREKFGGEVARCGMGQLDVLLVRPMTFMNESGRCIQSVLGFFRIPVSELLVVHDELDLPFGTLRLKPGGGHAGHNGLRSIAQHLGTTEFARLRMGIGRPPPGFQGEIADFVLSDFDTEQRHALPELVSRGVKALRMVYRRGFAEAAKAVNTKPKPPKSKPAETSESGDQAPQSSTDSKEGVASPKEKS